MDRFSAQFPYSKSRTFINPYYHVRPIIIIIIIIITIIIIIISVKMGHPWACTRTWHFSVFHLFCGCQFCLRSSVSRLCGASNSGLRLSSVCSTDVIQLIFWVFQNVSHCQQQSYSGTRLPRWSFSTYLWNDPWVQSFHNFNLVLLTTLLLLLCKEYTRF